MTAYLQEVPPVFSVRVRELLPAETVGWQFCVSPSSFRHARRQGILNTPNPTRDVEIPRRKPKKQTHAYTLEAELKMLSILPEPAATVVAAASFLGTREGELRGFRWENYDGEAIRIVESVWRGHVGEPKGEKSKSTVPVIPHLRKFLDRHRVAKGNPAQGFVFANAQGRPMNLDALARDVLRPIFEHPGLKWHGWHAFRRGLATNPYRLGVKDKVIQQILRHAKVTTSMDIYVEEVSEDAVAALDVLEKRLCATGVQPEAISVR